MSLGIEFSRKLALAYNAVCKPLCRELGLPVAKSLVALVKLDFSVPYLATPDYQKLFRQVHP